MISFKRTLVPLALAAAVILPIAGSMAQQQPAQPPAPPRNLPTPDAMQRMFDGRIAQIKATLKLNDAQLKLFGPVEDVMRANHAVRERFMRERFQRATASPQTPPAPPALTERLDRMVERADRIKAFVAAFKPFHATLSDEQKAVVGPLLRGFAGMDKERGQRGMRGQHRFHHGRFQGPQPQ